VVTVATAEAPEPQPVAGPIRRINRASKLDEPNQPGNQRPATSPLGPRNQRRLPVLSEEDRAAIRATVAALQPLSDEQISGVCEVIVAARQRWHRHDHTAS
jgi:hypothetical protein